MAAPDPECNGCCSPRGYLWGHAALGLGSFVNHRDRPPLLGFGGTTVPKQGDWVFLTTGPGRSYGILADGSLWAWGQAPLGDGTLNSYSNPKKISSQGDRWKYVATTSTHTLAIKEDGSLWSWGSNASGQLGNGNKYPDFTTNPRVFLSGSIESINFPEDGVSIGNQDPQPITFKKSDDNDPGSGAAAEYEYECRLTGGVYLSSPGSGYKSQPTVVVQPTGSTEEISPTSFSITMRYSVASVAIEDGGSGYASDCVVVFSDGLQGDTAEGEPVFESGVLTSISITKPGSYSSPPSISIRGRRVAQAVVSPVLSGYVSSFSLSSGGAYTGRSLSVSFSGGNPNSPAAVSGTPVFNTKITSVVLTNGGSGYTSKADNPLKAKMGNATLGDAILAPCSASSVFPASGNAWENGTGTVQPFETSLLHPDQSSLFSALLSLCVRENPPSPSVSLISYGMAPVPLSVSFTGTPVPDGGTYYYAAGLFHPTWSASLGESVSGIKGPIALKVDWPEMEFELPVAAQIHAMGTPPASGDPAGADAGADIYNLLQHNLEAHRWYAAEALVPFAPAGLTSIVDEGDFTSVVQTGFLPDPPDPEPECPPTPQIYDNVLTGDYCVLPLVNIAPKTARAWYGREGSYSFGGFSYSNGFPEYVPKTKFTLPAVSTILQVTANNPLYGNQMPVSASEPPTSYPTPSVIVGGDNEGPPCSISANFSSGRCFYSITSPGSGYRTEPSVTVTTTCLTPSPVIGGHQWKQVAVWSGESSGLLEDGTPMRWPTYGHYEPQKIGFSIAITEQESDGEGTSAPVIAYGAVFGLRAKWRGTKYSTPSNVEQLLPQTPGTLAFNPGSSWLGLAGRREITTHVGRPRLLYRLRPGLNYRVYIKGYGANVTALVGAQIPVTIDGQPGFAHQFPIPMNGVGPWGDYYGFYGTYWHSPSFPDYSSEYMFSKVSTIHRASSAWESNVLGACFLEAPSLGDGLTATLVSPGPCKELFYTPGGALHATASSGEVWALSSQKIAPFLGQDVPLEYETIKFHETKFTVKWEWELEDREVEWGLWSVPCPEWSPGPDGGPTGSPCVTETLKYKTLKPPSKEVVDESCGWGSDIQIIKDQEFAIEVTSGGSGYCKEDTGTSYPVDDSPYIRFSGGRVLVSTQEVTDGGGIDIESETFSRDSVGVPYQNLYYPLQPSLAGFTAPLPDGSNGFFFDGMWFPGTSFQASGWYAGGKAASAICDVFFQCDKHGSPQKTSVSTKAIKSLTWSNFSHRAEPVYVDLPELSLFRGISILDGRVVGVDLGAFNLAGLYGYSGFSRIIGFAELPSVELVFRRGAGSGAAIALKPALSRFSGPRPADKIKSASAAVLVREDGRVASASGGTLLPQTYGSDFSDTAGRSALSGGGGLYRIENSRPWPEPNLAINIGSPGEGYTLLPRIEVSQPSSKIATADVTFNAKLVSLGVDDGGFGYASPPTLAIDGSGEGECVISGPVSLVEVTGGGSGYSHAPKVRFTGPGWPGKATCSLGDNGSVASVSVQDGGDYRSPPGVAFDPIPEVMSVSISSGGSGYTSNPRVEIVGNCGGSGATATAKINGQVTAVEVTFGGSGYRSESPPQVVFSGGGGTDAAATVTIDDETGEVTGVQVTSGGSWYTSRPSVKLVGGAGRGASVRSTIAGPVGSLTLTNGGRDYLEPPVVLFIGGHGGGAAATATATVGTRGGGASATATINGSILYASVTSQGSGYEYSPKVQISGGDNREIARLDLLLSEGGISPEEHQKGVKAARGKIQSRIEGQVSAINITNPGSGYVAASQLQAENYYTTVPYRTDSVWAAGAAVRGVGYGGSETIELTPSVPACEGGGVSASAVPTKKYFQKPVFSMADAFTYNYGYHGNGVSARVESVRGSIRTSRGLREKKSFTKTLEGLRTESVSGPLLAHAGACLFTNVTGKRVRNPESTPVVYDKIAQLFQRGDGFDFRLTNLKFSESSPPKFELFDKTGTGATLETSLDGSGVIESIDFTSDGSSYTDQHRLQITGGRLRLVQCQATCNVDGQGRVTSITVTSPGDGYLSPAVIVHGGSGSGCLATAFLQSGFLPRGVRKIVVDSEGSGYSQDSPPSVYVAEFSPPFIETEFAKLINEKLLQYVATAWTGMTAEYAKQDDLPAFSSSTDYNFDSLVAPIFESGYSWDSSAKAMVDNFATFEYVETTAVDWASRVPEPYNGNVQITVSGTCDAPLSLTATGASWEKVFGMEQSFTSSDYYFIDFWGAAAIRT